MGGRKLFTAEVLYIQAGKAGPGSVCVQGHQGKWLLDLHKDSLLAHAPRAAFKELFRGQVFWCYQEGLITPRESI